MIGSGSALCSGRLIGIMMQYGVRDRFGYKYALLEVAHREVAHREVAQAESGSSAVYTDPVAMIMAVA